MTGGLTSLALVTWSAFSIAWAALVSVFAVYKIGSVEIMGTST